MQNDRSRLNSIFYTIDTKEFINPQTNLIEEQKNDFTNQEKALPKKQISETIQELKTINFSDIIADTTSLDQIYTEPTLNVLIKYPKGRTFIDQNKNEKLDGVTFWANGGLYNPPPIFILK